MENVNLKEVSGKREKKSSVVRKRVNDYEHVLKTTFNAIAKEAKKQGVPFFAAYYSETEGYVFNGVLPEEILEPTPDVESQYGKFAEFMKTCMGYNKEEFLGSEVIKTYGSKNPIGDAEE